MTLLCKPLTLEFGRDFLAKVEVNFALSMILGEFIAVELTVVCGRGFIILIFLDCGLFAFLGLKEDPVNSTYVTYVFTLL